ncbi:MAG: hypothetical protein KJZ91_16020 [Myxococcales bacterium]|nr:hypothetical protein [Myxococcales bacterium]
MTRRRSPEHRLLAACSAVAFLAAMLWVLPAARATTCRPTPATAIYPAADTWTNDRIVYVHGRAMKQWPAQALLSAAWSWSHQWMNFDGSARLTNATVRTTVANTLAANCTAPRRCVIVCHSAGCARTLLALDDLRAQGRPANSVLFIEAIASAAGGTEVANVATRWYVKLLAKLTRSDQGGAAAIDTDLTTGSMRGTFAYIQNGAGAPMYHYAGSVDLCATIKIKKKVAKGLSEAASYAIMKYTSFGGALTGIITRAGVTTGVAGAIAGFVVTAVIGFFLSKVKLKVCGNSYLPGRYGDGAVPVHSAAGYADQEAHASHHDGAAKFAWRTYAQVPLFPQDHRGIFAPGVYNASLHLAGVRYPACEDTVRVPAEVPEALITTEEADSVPDTDNGELPLAAAPTCGSPTFSGDNTLYSTCADGCCNQDREETVACGCGEALCVAAADSFRSYYSGPTCDGIEYASKTAVCSDGQVRTWDGFGQVGAAAQSGAYPQSWRDQDGICRALAVTYDYTTYYAASGALVPASQVGSWGGGAALGGYGNLYRVYRTELPSPFPGVEPQDVLYDAYYYDPMYYYYCYHYGYC